MAQVALVALRNRKLSDPWALRQKFSWSLPAVGEGPNPGEPEASVNSAKRQVLLRSSLMDCL